MFKLSLGFPQFFFLRRFIKFLFGSDEGKLGIFFLVLFLEIFEDRIYVIAISNSRSIILHSFVLKKPRLDGVLLAGLLEFLFRGTEDIDLFVLLFCVELCSCRLLLENYVFAGALGDYYVHSFEIVVL